MEQLKGAFCNVVGRCDGLDGSGGLDTTERMCCLSSDLVCFQG